MTLALLLLLETLTLAASAARLDFPPAATPTVEDGANAVLLRPSPTPTARFATAELLHGRDYTMGQDTCGFGSAQRKLSMFHSWHLRRIARLRKSSTLGRGGITD